MIHIALCFDNNYSMPAGVLITSILQTQKTPIMFHIFGKRIDKKNIEKLRKTINGNVKFYDANNNFTNIVACEKILYLGIDMLVTAPLDDLWEIDVSDVSVACVKSSLSMLLINLKKWQEKNITEEFLEKLDKKMVSERFNFETYPWTRKPLQTPVIIHFLAEYKPWHKDVSTLYQKEWRDVKRKSLWANDKLCYANETLSYNVGIKSRIKNIMRSLLGFDINRNKRTLKARLYFFKNKNRIKNITSWLADRESKETFKKIILWKQGKLLGAKPFHGDGEKHYFVNDFFHYGKEEVFIDCGAFIGDTIECFLKLPNMEYKQVVAFEPGTENFNFLKSKFGNKQNFMLVNAGAYSRDCELFFTGGDSIGKISETSTGTADEISIKVRAIDNLAGLEKVTFIKMDIEGAEMDALIGAKETILRDKPKLAISIYHSNEDMLRIAEYIHALVPEYKLYVRHHGAEEFIHPIIGPCETVLYAKM